MKTNKITRRSFLLGLGVAAAASALTACGGSSSSTAASASSSAAGSAAGSDTVYRTLDEIKADGTVNIGVFSDKNPFGYVDENGEYQGYDVYFANRLGEDLDVEVNFVSTEAANRIEYLQTGKVDIILANFTVTPERAEEVDFALPYMNVALGVISPDSNVITSLDDWKADDQMIVISGTTAETYLVKNYPNIPLQKYDSYATAKNALENGNGVAWANDNTEVIAFAKQNPGYTVGIPSLGSADTIAVRNLKNGLVRLRRELNEAAAAKHCPGPLALESEPLKVTLDAATLGMTGTELAEALRCAKVECEYADPRYLVLMFTPENPAEDMARLEAALAELCARGIPPAEPPAEHREAFCALARQAEPRLTVRQAVFAPQETIPAGSALGRVCALPTVSCPPAIPIVVSGEVIGPAALELFAAYGVETVSVVKPEKS